MSEGHNERSCGAGLWTVTARKAIAKALIRCLDAVLGTHRPVLQGVQGLHLAGGEGVARLDVSWGA